MHLWTEYEGNTLAGYPLGRLSRSEGRSAFFSTSTPSGQLSLIRLTESHFDEDELLGRWRKAAAVSHPGLQGLGESGQTTHDDVPLTFCLLEASDASLSDVLRDRVLSSDETMEVAEAVAGALAALHAAGLIHGHIDATNVFAMGERVKLRSDCVRECTGDFEADTAEAREALRQRDVHDLGLLLRRCLTPQWQEATAVPLPSPFDRIVRRALNGVVTAAGIVADIEVLKPAASTPPQQASRPVAAPTYNATSDPARTASSVDGVAEEPPVISRVETGNAANDPVTRPSFRAPAEPESPSTRPVYAGMPVPQSRSGSGSTSLGDDKPRFNSSIEVRFRSPRNRSRQHTGTTPAAGDLLLQKLSSIASQPKAWIASTAVVLLLGFVSWSLIGGTQHAAAGDHTAAAKDGVVATVQLTPAPSRPVAQQPVATVVMRTPQAKRDSLFTSGAKAGWHVIAYTYNSERLAQARVTQLRQRYVKLQPQVYSPTGHAPFFVALGGPSDAAGAMMLRNRARQAGMPRDTYARNF